MRRQPVIKSKKDGRRKRNYLRKLHKKELPNIKNPEHSFCTNYIQHRRVKTVIKFIYRLLLNIGLFLLVQLPLQLLGSVLLLIYLYCNQTATQLPLWLKWFDGADQYIGRNTLVYNAVMAQDWWTKYVWLAWRNPINYFEYTYLGYKVTGKEKYTILGSVNVGDSTNDEPGFKYIELDTGIYEYYFIHKWNEKTCFRFRFGYKIGDTNNKKDSYIQHVLTLSPYKSYSGR